ncbi:MAG: major capsid protein, partial [Bacteroidetes bacterium]|nr:major capsid protein [Bacteroidota bacterium]
MAIEFPDLTRAMSKSLEKAQPKPKMILQFFPNKERYETEVIELDKKFKGARVAKFVNPDAVADGREKLSFDNYVFKLPTMQDLMSLTSKELNKRLFGQNVYTQTTTAAKGAVLVKEIQEEQKDFIETLMEVKAIEAVFDGQITIIGKGENRVIDFDRKAANTVDLGPGSYWDEAGGAPENDIEDFITRISADGSRATHIIGRAATIQVLVKKLKLNDPLAFDGRRVDTGSITFKSMLEVNGSIYKGTYNGLEIWAYDGVYVDEDGNSQTAVPAKKVVVLSADNKNVDVCGYAGDMDIDFPSIGGNTRSSKDSRQFISKVTKGKKSFDVEAIQT